MSSCSAIDLAEIRWPFKISSWIWSIIFGVVTVLGRPGRGVSQVEKSTRLNRATQFLTVAYDGAYSPYVSVRMAWISFDVLLAGKKTWWQLASPWCWNRASPDILHFSLGNKKYQTAEEIRNRVLKPKLIGLLLVQGIIDKIKTLCYISGQQTGTLQPWRLCYV